MVKTNPSSRFPPSASRGEWGGRSSCSNGTRSDINEDHAEHSPAQAYVVKGSKCAIALVAQSDSERWSTEPEVAGSNPAGGTCCSLLLQCANRFLSHEGGENSINFPRKPCSGFSLLYPAAWVGISHAGQPWWGGSWPSFRSPNGRGMVLNINQCGFESCRKHDVRQKVTRKRTNTQIRWYRRPRAKQGENSDERKKKLRCLFLNQMLFRVCSRSSVESEPPVSTRLVVGSNPTGSTLEDWRSGRTYLS